MQVSSILLLICIVSRLVNDSLALNIRLGRLKTQENIDEKQSSPINRDNNKALLPLHRRLYDLTVQPPFDPSNDLGLRFSKIDFLDPNVDTSRLPLSAADYPIQMETALWLSQSQCPSVTIPEICPECTGINLPQVIQDIGGPPTHASPNPGSEFWAELLEVTLVQEQRKDNVDVRSVMPLPEIWNGYNLNDVAEAVHDEYPGLHNQALIQYLLGDGATVDNNTVPQHCNAEFLRGIVMLSHLNTWAIAKVGPINFAVKYHVGRARPEEIANKISTRVLNETSGVPQTLLELIPPGSIPYMEYFTAYPEGSPMHPSWPAMHSAASVASLWLPVVMNLTEEQHCQAKLVDYGVAYARTVAGVHYASDNMAGLKLGNKLLQEYLPEYLEEMYGSDPDKVRAKIAAVNFDWDTFMDSDCYQNRVS